MTEEVKNAKVHLTLAVEERQKCFALVTHLWDKSKTMEINDIDFLTAYIDELASLKEQFELHNNKITKCNGVLPPADQIDTVKPYIAFMDLLFNIKSHYRKLKRSEPPPASVVNSTPTVSNPFSNLPKIQIPKFDGTLESWPNFYSLFNSLVHSNEHLDDVSKLQYLKTCIIGDAAAVISDFHLTSENYMVAYEALTSRYQSQRRIAQMYLRKIVDYKPNNSNSLSHLKNFINAHENSINALKALNLDDLGDFILLSLALKNIDSKTRQAFEDKHSSDTIPPYSTLIDFVNLQIKNIENSQSFDQQLDRKPVSRKAQSYLVNSTPAPSKRTYSSPSISNSSCFCCSQSHSIAMCEKFAKLSTNAKYDVVKKHQRCFNCLGSHLRLNCNSTSVCKKCSSPAHHSLLHPSADPSSPSTSKIPSPSTSATPRSEASSNLNVSFSCATQFKGALNRAQPLLGTFRALIGDSSGSLHPVRGVIDPGSQLSFINSALVRNLKLPTTSTELSITGIGASDTSSSYSAIVNIISRISPQNITVQAAVLSSISPPLPSAPLSHNCLKQFRHLQLADPFFNRPDKIDLLLGADVFPSLLMGSTINPAQNGPASLKTIFGWIIIGPVAPHCQTAPTCQTAHTCPTAPPVTLLSTAELGKQLTQFWEIESVPPKKYADPLELLAEHHFASTFSRDSSGRYIVSLPFNPSATPMGHNAQKSRSSLLRLETRLSKDSFILNEYQNFMQDYLEADHMQPSNLSAPYVIPHHIVTKETNHGPKIRVVFNASSVDNTGVSLNDRLLKGPKLQQDLSHVLLAFRLNTVALCCDIRQMYRQVLIHPDHRQYQHVFWRPNGHSAIQEMQLNTVTYGMAPSAFLAVRVLRQLVQDEGHKFPLASRAILHHAYVDDIICGASSLSEATLLQSQLTQLLALGGFQLRKWSSSHPELLESLPDDHLESPLIFSDPEKTLKILGINWEPSSDSFVFRVSSFEGVCTKRSMLSYIARIFDPVGYLSPVTFSLKLQVQLLWLSSHNWDQPVSEEIQNCWNNLVSNLHLLSNLAIPRHFAIPSHSSLSLIGFADASQHGYSAVVYLCAETANSRLSNLWKSKTRVAPLKTLSIPRLELCAAVLLSDLITSLLDFEYPTPLQNIRLFSDSQVTLSWLKTSPHLLKTFVAHRVSHILDLPFDRTTWSHVRSELNPADMASRGLLPQNFVSPDIQNFWFNGPPFANDVLSPWPSPYDTSLPHNSLPEMRCFTPTALITTSTSDFLHSFIAKFSTLQRARRVLAWILRFCSNVRHKDVSLRTKGDLQANEIQASLQRLVIATQSHYFKEEIRCIKLQLPSKSLQGLTPFIDSVGVLRVGGRLSQSSLPISSKHPILLPKQSHLSLLICRHAHLTCLHAGPTTCMAHIRMEFWILSLRSLIRSVITSCLTCKRFRAQVCQPIMADLPSSRINPGRPFLTSGVDFAGPFKVKSSRLRKAPITKGYLCLFVCFTTKSLHLEFVSELTTAAFLGALDRFIARRGLPHSIYSDRGTNFVGARHSLIEASQFLKDHHDDVTRHLSNVDVQWHLNPPYAPNFGGLWEAGVKSVKTLLWRITAEICFTCEEYFTLFAKIEAILNSRPLCPLSSDPEEAANYLSPGHFLIGSPLLCRPELPPPQKLSLHDRWKAISHITRQFWQKWSHEYLNTLIQRSKWTRHSSPINVDDVVFLKNTNTPPLTWPIARVTSLHPGPDGITRVTLKNSSGCFTRPVNRLVPLGD